MIFVTGFGVGIVVGIVLSSLSFGIVIITVVIIVKHRMKGNLNLCTNLPIAITPYAIYLQIRVRVSQWRGMWHMSCSLRDPPLNKHMYLQCMK